ncbi:hypothetical protein ACFWZ2_24540 [Streptomyces sp. NPDC059002]|uniref:hypothetical protein n=1 Tax=Streptomyces sp. NPDC059002 TaxID=3346690 RepID=UPI0036843EC9
MGSPKVDRSLQRVLAHRQLFLRTEHGGRTVIVCLQDGSRDGFEIGRVLSGHGKTGWAVRHRRRLPDGTYGVEENEGLPWIGLDEHIADVLRLAAYADVLRRREVSSGTATTYTARLGPELAAWLAEVPAPQGITDLGDGRVRLTESAVAFLRCPSTHYVLTLTVHPDMDTLMIEGVNAYNLTREE